MPEQHDHEADHHPPPWKRYGIPFAKQAGKWLWRWLVVKAAVARRRARESSGRIFAGTVGVVVVTSVLVAGSQNGFQVATPSKPPTPDPTAISTTLPTASPTPSPTISPGPSPDLVTPVPLPTPTMMESPSFGPMPTGPSLPTPSVSESPTPTPQATPVPTPCLLLGICIPCLPVGHDNGHGNDDRCLKPHWPGH